MIAMARTSDVPSRVIHLLLSAIDAEEFYDYVLAHAPEFVRGRQEADDAIAGGELGVPLADVLAELDAEERGDRRSV
jgi:hypothetical protein